MENVKRSFLHVAAQERRPTQAQHSCSSLAKDDIIPNPIKENAFTWSIASGLLLDLDGLHVSTSEVTPDCGQHSGLIE